MLLLNEQGFEREKRHQKGSGCALGFQVWVCEWLLVVGARGGSD